MGSIERVAPFLGGRISHRSANRPLTNTLVITKILYMELEPAILNAIASPRRQEILRLIWREEQTAGAIHRAMPDVTFGAVSLQLRSLIEARLVEGRREPQNRPSRAR